MASATRIDGRVQRGERTRDAIANALLALLAEGGAPPTAREIAERAGVSLRSVFQHFDDMEALYAMCVRRQQERIAELMSPIDATAALPARIDAFVAQRARLYEQIAPVRRAARVAAANSPTLREGMAHLNREHHRDVAVVFASELDGRASRREQLAALEVATSFDAWDHLRTVQGCSVAVARGVVVRLVTGIVEEAP